MTPRVVIIIVTAVLASLLEIIDSSIVNVAIPTMMGNLGSTLDEISWVSTGYMIANSIVLPIAAWIGSTLGRRRYFTSAILLFTLASFLCGISPNLTCLVFFRILQGLAGGALLPTSQTLIQEQFPREKAGLATAIFGMSVMIGPALGPTMGGYLTDNFGWRSIFNINIPLGLAAAFMSWTNVEDIKSAPKVEGAAKKSVDWLGLFFLCLGVGCLQFILERGEVEGWWDSNLIKVLSLASMIGVSSFIYWELKIDNPIMNLRLFKESVIRSGTLLMLMLGVMVYALTFVIPIFVDRVIHLTATQTGELFIPGSILTAMTMLPVGLATRKMNPKYLVCVGILICEAALFTCTLLNSQSGANNVYLPLILRGMGTAFLFIPINGMVLGQFRGEKLGQAAGMQNFFRQLGGSIGIASLSTLLTRFSAQNYTDLMAHVTALHPAAQSQLHQAMGLPSVKMASQLGMGIPSILALQTLYNRTQQQVFIMSFNQLCWVIMMVIGCAFIPLLLIRSPKKLVGPAPDVH